MQKHSVFGRANSSSGSLSWIMSEAPITDHRDPDFRQSHRQLLYPPPQMDID